jgi:transcriptional regulator GlxA family with amidase domain
MLIAALLFDDLTPLDVVGPLEVLARAPRAEVVLAGRERGTIRDPRTHLTLTVEASLDELTAADVLVAPGGFGVDRLCDDEAVLDWIRRIHATTRWTTSVCTGSLLLAAAGLLTGVSATTHWASRDALERYGAVYTDQRVVERGKIVTAAGVSAGIDMALHLLARIGGDQLAKAVQLSIEYDPQPPFDTGSPAKAGPDLVGLVRAASARARTTFPAAGRRGTRTS